MIVGVDIDKNIVNIWSVQAWQRLYVSSNTYATFEAQFMIILSNTEAELKKSVACTKKKHAAS